MAGIKTPIFTRSFMVKLKYITKGRLLATNPWNYFELVLAVYWCFPEIYNIEDYQIFFNDAENEWSVIDDDECL